IGNNLGARRDLTIYRVPLSELSAGNAVNSEAIRYSYADQTVFDGGSNSDWDAEALIAYGDELIIFTKQWQSLGTVAYTLPKTPGEYLARPVGTNAVNGLVTGATYNQASGLIYLVGYSTLLQPFLYRIADPASPFSLSESGQRFNLELGFAQIEAITAVDENNYLLSSEAFSSKSPPITLNPSLFGLRTSDVQEDPADDDNDGSDSETGSTELSVFVPFGTRTLQYNLQTERDVFGWEIFDLSGRRVDKLSGIQITENQIDISALSSSVYYLSFYLRGQTISKPFFLN
ncbi:MAG: T9SS type A sorting domain-containing protein, partial [Eudoraea sp.]|nr:T9SS type A sorting domain-containing protein [Eudoraea sp.]